MNTFLKVLLVALAVVVAIKLLPLTLFVGVVIGLAALATIVVGASAAVILLGIAIAIVAALAPVWLPVLAILGIIALFRKVRRA